MTLHEAGAGTESMRAAAVRRATPGLLLAFALNGFFLYLGALDLLGVEPNSRITGPFYVAVGAALGAVAAVRRDLLRVRLHDQTKLVRVWVLAAGTLAAWFLIAAMVRSEGRVARDAAFLLVVFCLPSTALTLSLRLSDVAWLARGLVATGLVYAFASAIQLIRLDEGVSRFSPIDELNPISAAGTAAIGAVACLALRPASGLGRVGQAAAFATLTAAAILPGARGPIVALGVGVAAAAALNVRIALRLAPAFAIGLAIGLMAAEQAGSTSYLGVNVPLIDAPAPTGADFTGERLPPGMLSQEPISSANIRRQLLVDAIEAIPDQPFVGHGIGMLRDESEDTRRMVESGRIDSRDTLTHPHNVLIESAYSLGLPGLALFLTLIATALLALIRSIRAGGNRSPTVLALGFFAAAAVSSNLSGELGMDAYVWVALSLPVAVYVARREDAASR